MLPPTLRRFEEMLNVVSSSSICFIAAAVGKGKCKLGHSHYIWKDNSLSTLLS